MKTYDLLTVRKTRKRRNEANIAEERLRLAAEVVKEAEVRAKQSKERAEELQKAAVRKAARAQVALQ